MKTFGLILLLNTLFFSCYSQEWITYNSPDNSFKIKFPEQPEVMTIKSGLGTDSTQIIQYLPKSGENAITTNTLTVMYLSEEILKPDLNKYERLELLKKYPTITVGLTGEVLSNEEISLSGFSGIYTKGQITQGVMEEPYPTVFIKSYLVENKLFQIMTSCSYENRESEFIDYFFDSFELIE